MAKPALKSEILDDPFDLGGVEIDPHARDKREAVYPFIQWMNGIAKAKIPGYLYIPSKEFTKAASLPKWTSEEVTFENGDKDAHGLVNPAAQIVVIRSRKRWKSKGQEKNYLPWGANVKGQNMTGQHQYLVALRDCPQLFVLTAGYAASQGIEAALNTHHAQIISAANKTSKQCSNFPSYAFWLPLRGDKFETVGTGKEQKQYAKPSINLPDVVDVSFLKNQFVGAEALAAFQEAYKQADDWAQAWDNADDMNTTDNTAWACGEALVARYLHAIDSLMEVQADPDSIVTDLQSLYEGAPQRWTAAQMTEALEQMSFAYKKAKSGMAKALQAPPSDALFEDGANAYVDELD